MAETVSFNPTWFSIPGSSISAALSKGEIGLQEFSIHVGLSLDDAIKLLDGVLPITEDLAEKLEVSVGGTSQYWLNRQSRYEALLDECAKKISDDDGRAWLSQLPINEMRKMGWVASGGDKLSECLKFFETGSIEAWQEKYETQLKAVSFRASSTHEVDQYSTIAWLRRGHQLAEKIQCKPWDVGKFSSTLSEIKKLTRIKQPSIFLSQLVSLCAECGVAVVIQRAPKGTRASGATMFTNPSKALILLSMRYLSDDQFWFTFFHEAGHLVLHDKNALFIEDDSDVTQAEEAEADEFSFDTLIPHGYQEKLHEIELSKYEIVRFANACSVSPGIIVGQLQHMGRIRHNQLNWLKRRYRWNEM
ncbi:hypothetical protein RHODOSMS8_02015 [Rhodobiaceae bacterium]|nr:hypothetical protein RHODOSMS8_02015 [Rhodobiaceae bacterium]